MAIIKRKKQYVRLRKAHGKCRICPGLSLGRPRESVVVLVVVRVGRGEAKAFTGNPRSAF